MSKRTSIPLTEWEITFLKLARTKKSYKEVGFEMNISFRTVGFQR